MKFFLIIVIAVISYSSCHSKTEKKLTGDFDSDIKLLLPEGKVTADIMDQVKINPRLQLLMGKFQMAMRSNPEWFLQMQKDMEAGKKREYDPKIEMTKEEFDEFGTFMEKNT